MQCPRCHAENREGRRFCAECGASLTLACPSCGFANEPAERFCGGCGAALTSLRAAGTPRFGSAQSYTPKHLAEKILTSKAALEGERKLVTVLFADLKGSMELLADRDPEEARRILDPVLERMMEAVHRYEGTVNQVMGDGIMALFGAPLAHEDHAVRACYAALRMQEAVKAYAEEMFRTQGLAVQIRVGVNSGEVVVRSIGSDLHMDYTAIGHTTHLAARMEQLATAGTILLAPETLKLAEGYIAVRSRGAVPVKGLSEPVEVFEVTGAGPARTRLQAAIGRGLTRFVGREAELDQLRQALHLAADGHGQVVTVVGEAGVGKSRLVYEFTRSHRTQGWLLLESGSVSYGKATAYLPVIDLLKGYFKIQDRDDQREIRDKVLGRVLGLDRALEPLLPPVLALLDVPADDPGWQALDPPQRRQRTLEAVKRLLLRESQVQPLLVVFEDLHWIDGETQALLDSLVDSLGPTRVLLLVNYRPEYEPRWGKKTYYTQLRLDSLPPASTEELLGALLGTDPGLESLTQRLIKRGNPFFVEETVRTLVETGALAGERGAYRLTRPVEALQIPVTVQAILAARIDRLPGDEKQLLQVASVIGKDVPYGILEAIADRPEDVLRRGLGHLQEAEFLYETSLFPDLEYTFKHALTHEVTYGTLLGDRRRGLHARIVEVMEQLYADRLAEHVERLGHHAFQGEAWDKAAAYFRQAGTKAADRSAYREAVTCFERTLDALAHLPERRDTIEHAIDARLDLRHALVAAGDIHAVHDHLREAERLAESLGDQRRLAAVSALLGWAQDLRGEHERDVESAHRALAIATELRDVPLQVAANLYLSLTCMNGGDYRGAVECGRRNVQALTGDLMTERFGLLTLPAVTFRAWLVWGLAEMGEFAEGIAIGEEAMRIATAVDRPWSLAIAYGGIGHLFLLKGELDRALSMLERSLEHSERWHFPFLSTIYSGTLGYVYALAGRLDASLPLLERAIEQAERVEHYRHAQHLVWLSHAYLLSGRTDKAAEHAERALQLSRTRGERGSQAWAHRLLGELASATGVEGVTTAEDSYGHAMTLASELGMRPLIAHCHLGLGTLYARTGRREDARQHLGTATRMYREMDMRWRLEKTQADAS